MVLLILLSYGADAKTLPYLIQNNSLIIDGNAYWDNGVKYQRTNDIVPYSYKGYDYANIGNIYKTYLSSNNTRDILVEYDNTSISFSLQNLYFNRLPQYKLNLTRRQVSIDSRKFNFSGDDFDYNITKSDNILKEEYYLSEKPFIPLVWTFVKANDTLVSEYYFNYTGLDLYINGNIWNGTLTNTTENITFKRNSELLYTIPYVFAVDNNNNITRFNYYLTKENGINKLGINISLTWLKNASYPVIIDPSLNLNGGSTTLDGTYYFDWLNLSNGAILSPTIYNGTGTTGNLTLFINKGINQDTTSSIIADYTGYQGGVSYGDGGKGYNNNNGGVGDPSGGSCGNDAGGGGGAGHATTGGTGGAICGGAGGVAYGNSSDLSTFMGGGGGAGGNGNGPAGSGGQPGGGIVSIFLNRSATINISGKITSKGGVGGTGRSNGGGYYTGTGGGGAAGGTILIYGDNVNLTYASINVSDGAGGPGGYIEYTSYETPGNRGSGGRIKIFYRQSYNAGSNYLGNGGTVSTQQVLTYSNVTISTSIPSSNDNLKAFFNVYSPLGVSTNYTVWYKNGVMNTSLNDTLTVLANNLTNGDTWYFQVWGNDTFGNGSVYTSNSVIIGSSNSAPSFTTLTLQPTTIKYNKNITVNASGIVDDSASWQGRFYYINDTGYRIYFINSSFVTNAYVNVSIKIPWNDGLTHTIYAEINDSGNITGQSPLVSVPQSATFTSDITAPTLVTSSLSASSITLGDTVLISAQFDGQNANISSALVRVERPDASIANWTMTCGSGANVTCTYSYTSTASIGQYFIRFFYPTDDSGNSGSISSSLTFTASAASSGGGGGGGGGGNLQDKVVVVNAPAANISTLLPQVNFVNQTDIRSTADLEKIGQCLSSNLMLSSACAGGTINIVTNPMNYWVLIGAFLASFGIAWFLAIYNQKKIAWFTDPAIFGVAAITITMILTLVGLNMFFFNYLFNDSKPLYMTASFALWSVFVSAAGFQLMYGGKRNRTFEFIIGTPVKESNDWAHKEWSKMVGKK